MIFVTFPWTVNVPTLGTRRTSSSMFPRTRGIGTVRDIGNILNWLLGLFDYSLFSLQTVVNPVAVDANNRTLDLIHLSTFVKRLTTPRTCSDNVHALTRFFLDFLFWFWYLILYFLTPPILLYREFVTSSTIGS